MHGQQNIKTYSVCLNTECFMESNQDLNIRAITDRKSQKCNFCGHFLTCMITLQSKVCVTCVRSYNELSGLNLFFFSRNCKQKLKITSIPQHVFDSAIICTRRLLFWTPVYWKSIVPCFSCSLILKTPHCLRRSVVNWIASINMQTALRLCECVWRRYMGTVFGARKG